ncbi:nudix hydrolase 16, mitochondrial-like isoform X2 [Aristolochia californica]|uniref:nudix hydrolase 16, mitochondrial-like isoform X2 n=1 Tax=Aristolochia californica TaxID=171875 RepID=UPI0035E38D92
MTDLVARTGRHQQRYEAGCRLVAGCIPFRYTDDNLGSESKKTVEVLMINSQSGPGLLFPKGGWENDETDREAAVREALEEAGVRGDIMVKDLHNLTFISIKSMGVFWGTTNSRVKLTKMSSAQMDYVKLPCLLCSSRKSFIHGQSRIHAKEDG